MEMEWNNLAACQVNFIILKDTCSHQKTYRYLLVFFF